jgi:hypothetical protein
MKLYEILVPTIYGDTMKPISTKHHRNWDAWVMKLSNGLTLLSPAKGRWRYQGDLYTERIIPVRIMCSEKQMQKIVEFTLKHYRQKAVMFYTISDNCSIIYA